MGKRRWTVLLLSFHIALLAVLGGFLYQQHLALEELRLQQNDAEAQAIFRLLENVAEIDLVLQKEQHATSSEVFSALGTRLYGRAAAAYAALENLPAGQGELAAFLVRVGEHARNLAGTSYGRTGHTATELAEWQTLSEKAALLAEHLMDASTSQVLAEAEEVLAGVVPVFAPISAAPLTTVGVERARAEAAAFAGLRESIFTHVDTQAEGLSVYQFFARVDGGDFLVEVCQVSGRVVRAENTRQVRRPSLSAEEGLEKARDFLARNGYGAMTLRHWWQEDHQVAANFVPVRDGVLFYPAEVQIRVGLDNGRVTGFLAEAYQADDWGEVPLEPAVTKEEALAAVPGTLTVEGYDMVVIASAGEQLILYYAFQSRAADGQAYLVYVNAETGRQQNIRLLVEGENGRFSL